MVSAVSIVGGVKKCREKKYRIVESVSVFVLKNQLSIFVQGIMVIDVCFLVIING